MKLPPIISVRFAQSVLGRLGASLHSCHHVVLGTEILIRGGELGALLSVSESYGVGLMMATGAVIALVEKQLRQMANAEDMVAPTVRSGARRAGRGSCVRAFAARPTLGYRRRNQLRVRFRD